MASNFQLLPTPNPDEFMFSVFVPDQKINPELFLGPEKALLKAGVTRYKEFLWAVNAERANEKWGDYIYVSCSKGGAGGISFLFGKPKTENSKEGLGTKNIPFKVFSDTQNYTWPAVLIDLYAIKTTTFPLAINNGSAIVTTPRVLPRYKFIPEVNYNSNIVVRQFLSPTPWREADLTHEQPVPTDVNGSYIGVQMDFIRCLHPTIVFPELQYTAEVIVGVGNLNPPPGRNPNKTTIPATNFLDWENFILRDTQQYVNGMWLREQVEIFPPPQPEETIQ